MYKHSLIDGKDVHGYARRLIAKVRKLVKNECSPAEDSFEVAASTWIIVVQALFIT